VPSVPWGEAFTQLHYFWGDWTEIPLEVEGYHVTVEMNSLYLYHYQGDPVAMPVLNVMTLADRIGATACQGNQIVALHGRRLTLCTLSATPVISVPPLAAGAVVQAVPNPFNPKADITFAMPTAGAATVRVHDLRGRCVRTLSAELPIGPARLAWDGRDHAGRELPSGTYLLEVSAAGRVTSGRCTLVR